jgi:hypothetical protein
LITAGVIGVHVYLIGQLSVSMDTITGSLIPMEYAIFTLHHWYSGFSFNIFVARYLAK